ncbi:MAG: hypothetical protein ACI85O_000281 [Saprospiraceae bacterium]|jgi:hypothetical protein
MNSTTTSEYQFSSPHFRWLGYALWFVMAVMSVIFYKERATFMDGGFQLTELINSGEFGIYHHRLTNPLTQILALAAIKLNLSLKVVMIAYSLNFILFFTLIYHFITSWCKNDFLGWTQIAFFTLLTTDSFYFLTPEFYQGMSLLLLWFAMILHFDFRRQWLFPVLLLLLIPIIFDHLLLSAFFAFLWCFFYLHETKLRRLEYWLLAAGMIGIFVIHQEFFTSWYDAMKTKDFRNNLETYFPNFQSIPAHLIFLKKCVATYYFFPLALVALSIGYISTFFTALKSNLDHFYPLLKLGLVLGFCFCYLLVIHIGDPNTPYIFYSEVNYIGLVIPVTIALLFDFAPRVTKQNILLIGFAIIMLIRLGTISMTHNKFESRHDWIRHELHTSTSNRLIIKAEDAPQDIYIQDWSIPYESLLITALEGPTKAKSLLIATEKKQYKDFLEKENLLLEVMRQTDVETLNKRYFDLGVGKYLVK